MQCEQVEKVLQKWESEGKGAQFFLVKCNCPQHTLNSTGAETAYSSPVSTLYIPTMNTTPAALWFHANTTGTACNELFMKFSIFESLQFSLFFFFPVDLMLGWLRVVH